MNVMQWIIKILFHIQFQYFNINFRSFCVDEQLTLLFIAAVILFDPTTKYTIYIASQPSCAVFEIINILFLCDVFHEVLNIKII